ncbi:MAG: DoxX family protein [Verrucomicrobia bacterium]|nr:DoxX family protein [Verrucomicrobiota bacterium]
MNIFQIGIAYIGRVFLSLIFLFSAIIEVVNWPETEQYFTTIFTRWMQVYQGDEGVSLCLANLLSWLPTILIVGIVLRFLGSLLMILGWKVRLGSVCLMVFLLAETLIVYDFWHLTGTEQTIAMTMFFKNLAIFGGLMVVLSFGKGVGRSKEVK